MCLPHVRGEGLPGGFVQRLMPKYSGNCTNPHANPLYGGERWGMTAMSCTARGVYALERIIQNLVSPEEVSHDFLGMCTT